MMLFKLALRNIVKSIRDYAVYFATLVLGVAVFYVFNSIDSQTAMLIVSKDQRFIIDMITQAMSAVSVFVSFILGFLVIYASGFLMKRRKKEFGLYLVLGMGKRKVSTILVVETILVGLISLIFGLFIGVLASQGMSVFVANLFEADMSRFEFTISYAAIRKTILYFAIIFIVVVILQTLIMNRNRLINLLNAGKKSQKNYGKNPILCIIVFVIGAVLLGTAYYKVTAGLYEIVRVEEFITQIVKGIIGNFAVFWAMSGLLLILVKGRKRFYYRGLNCFTTKELAGRINTSVFAGGIISLILFFAISILATATSLKNAIDSVVERKVVMDVEFSTVFSENDITNADLMPDVIKSLLPEEDMLKNITCEKMYYDESINGKIFCTGPENARYFDEYTVPVMHISDYNRVAGAYGIEKYELESGEYMVIADYRQFVDEYTKVLKKGHEIEVNGEMFKPAYSECKNGFIRMSVTEDNTGIILLPDDVNLEFADYVEAYATANYATDDEKEIERYDDFFQYEFEEKFAQKCNGWNFIKINTANNTINGSVGIKVLLIFIGIYIGIIFLISSGAILSLKELSETADSKDKYMILRRLGVDERQIRHSLFAQCGLFFMFPLSLAIIHSVFGIKMAIMLMAVFGHGGLLMSIIASAGVIILIYGLYFLITYLCGRKIISE